MAANFSTLLVNNKHSNSDYTIVPPEKTHEIPHEINDAGVYINHIILVGEILGLDVQESISVMNILHRSGNQFRVDFPDRTYTGVPIIPELATELIKDFDIILYELDKAIDKEGRPLDIKGDSLKNSAHIGMDDEGRLFVKSHHIYLAELREMLESILKLLRYGIKNNVQIVLN